MGENESKSSFHWTKSGIFRLNAWVNDFNQKVEVTSQGERKSSKCSLDIGDERFSG